MKRFRHTIGGGAKGSRVLVDLQVDEARGTCTAEVSLRGSKCTVRPVLRPWHLQRLPNETGPHCGPATAARSLAVMAHDLALDELLSRVRTPVRSGDR